MIVNVKDVKDQKDGFCLVDIEYDRRFPKLVREFYGKKRCSKKLMERFINEGLKLYLDTHEKK